MGAFLDSLYAFFSPDVAINENGRLVHADGWFDSGNGSTAYLTQEQADQIREHPLSTPLRNAFSDDYGTDVAPSSPDVLSDGSYYENLIDRVNNAANNQNIASQTSADKAMEFTAEQNRIDRDFQAQQAQKAMDYQTEMSNTAYQRAMADMKAAGLNPKLVGQLGGASSPSGVAASGTGGGQGTSASMSMANTSAIAGVLESYISSAASLSNKDKDLVADSLYGLVNILGLALRYGL